MNVEQLELTEWCAAAECKLRWTCKIQIILQHGRDSIIEKYDMHLNFFIYFEKYLIKLLNNFWKGSVQNKIIK